MNAKEFKRDLLTAFGPMSSSDSARLEAMIGVFEKDIQERCFAAPPAIAQTTAEGQLANHLAMEDVANVGRSGAGTTLLGSQQHEKNMKSIAAEIDSLRTNVAAPKDPVPSHQQHAASLSNDELFRCVKGHCQFSPSTSSAIRELERRFKVIKFEKMAAELRTLDIGVASDAADWIEKMAWEL